MGGGGGGGGEGKEENCDNHLPLLLSEDVLIQILLWLPVISLLRFKTVCKSWRSIIESPFFIHLHHATPLPSSSSNLGGSSLIFEGYQEKKRSFLTLSGEEFEESEDLGFPLLVDLGEEFEGLKGWEDVVEFCMVGCCNGIICLHDFFNRNVSLWNPAIKQSRFLPKPSNLLGYYKCFDRAYINEDDGYSCEDFVRFGIDIKTNDYKVLLITTFEPKSKDYESVPSDQKRSESPHARKVHVYSLSTDSWRCLEAAATLSASYPDLDVYIDKHGNEGLHLNGSYFFTATYYNEEYNWNMSLLLSFDFTGEIFITIQPPFDFTNKYISGPVYFLSFGEKVALVDAKKEHDGCYGDFEYDIWVLSEQHDVRESWTKLYTFEPRPCFPRCIMNNEEFAIMGPLRYENDVYKLQLLNLITGEIKDLRYDCGSPIHVGVYKPSLVKIGGSGATDEKCM